MLRAIAWIVKVSLFSLLILVLGNMVRWRGRTISDQVRTQLSHAERSGWAGKVRNWGSEAAEDARKGIKKQWSRDHGKTPRSAGAHLQETASAKPEAVAEKESIPSSERQKLRALIRELNSSYRSSAN